MVGPARLEGDVAWTSSDAQGHSYGLFLEHAGQHHLPLP
jgi:hypothetical protein